MDLARGPGSAWERLSRYEQRLEQNIARAMRELRLYRKELRQHGRPEPAEDDTADAPAKAQNEPTAEETAASDGTAGGCGDVPRSMGVPSMHSERDQDMGEAPLLREEEQTRHSDG